MGTWGHGIFENDDAMDWVGELCEWEDFEGVHNAMSDVNDIRPGDEPEAPECACALAAAEVVAHALGSPSDLLPTDLVSWLGDHRLKVSPLLYRRTLAAIRSVKTKSELKELWNESKSGKAWNATVEELEARLAKIDVKKAPTKKTAKKAAKAKTPRGPRAKIGDLLEIKSKAGLNYAIYTHKCSFLAPHVIQIFDRTFKKRPADLAGLVKLPIRFATLTNVTILARLEPVSLVGNLGLPDHLAKFPLFRSGVADPKTGKVNHWWLWDGEKSWEVGDITREQRKLSIRGVPSIGYILDWLETRWRPETDRR